LKTWREAFDATWLANGDSVAALDNWARRTLAAHRGLGDDVHALESVAPWSVETLARSISALGDTGQWLWCITAIALIQELGFRPLLALLTFFPFQCSGSGEIAHLRPRHVAVGSQLANCASRREPR
jgi:hypothetical protein